MLTVERYRKTRFWAVYDCAELVCVTVYKKGANAVKERLERPKMAAGDSHREAIAPSPCEGRGFAPEKPCEVAK